MWSRPRPNLRGTRVWKASRGPIEHFRVSESDPTARAYLTMVFINSQFGLHSISSVIPRSSLSGVPNRSSPMWPSMTPPEQPKTILQSAASITSGELVSIIKAQSLGLQSGAQIISPHLNGLLSESRYCLGLLFSQLVADYRLQVITWLPFTAANINTLMKLCCTPQSIKYLVHPSPTSPQRDA